ncbi:hypothetical protein ABEX88_18820, partial [Priestia megaterium]
LITPQLISVQGFAFRRSLRLALQSTARRNETHESCLHNKKAERIGFSIKNPTRSDKPLFITTS